jgi:hypothetical protein
VVIEENISLLLFLKLPQNTFQTNKNAMKKRTKITVKGGALLGVALFFRQRVS